MAASLAATTFGVAAACCSMASFIPQVVKIIRERDAHSVSASMYLVTVTGFALWCGYGWLLGSWPLVVSNTVSFLLSGTVLALKLSGGARHHRHGGKH